MMEKRDKWAVAFFIVFIVVAAVMAAHLFSWRFVVVIYGLIFGSLLLAFIAGGGISKKRM